jgi:hypothetical protein
MSSDLVKRLLERGGYFPTIEREAADRIEALEGEIAALRNQVGIAQSHYAAAEARAERLQAEVGRAQNDINAQHLVIARLRVALEEISVMSTDRAAARTASLALRSSKALEDDKQ